MGAIVVGGTGIRISQYLFQDWKRNSRNPKGRLVMVSFRLAHLACMNHDLWWALPRLVIGLTYRVAIEWVLGVELPWRLQIGTGTVIYHGQGLVINDGAVLGRNVLLRNGVTIGHVRAGGPCPVVEDGVEFGANCCVLGGVRIGAGAKVGAGAVVLDSVPPGAAAVGNPARIVTKANDEGVAGQGARLV